MLDFMRGLPESQFPERDQSLFAKEVLQSGLRFWRSYTTPRWSRLSRRGGEVHHHDFIRLFHHPIRDRFPYPNAADLPDLIVQTFQMLDVHRGQNINTAASNTSTSSTACRALSQECWCAETHLRHTLEDALPG